MRILTILTLGSLCLLINACQLWTQTAPQESDVSAFATAQKDLGYKIGFDAYIYAFPMVEMDRVRQKQTKHLPENIFIHRRNLITAKYKTVPAPNNDTLYSGAWLDLQHQPLVISIPETGGRYYSIAFYDAYTNAFKIVSRRTHGSQARSVVITGPTFEGADVPDRTHHIKAPTDRVWALVRYGISGEQELETVRALQSKFLVTPLSDWRASGRAAFDLGLDTKVAQLTALANNRGASADTALDLEVEQLMQRFLERWPHDPSRVSHSLITRNFAAIGLTPENTHWRLTDSPIDQGAREGMEAARDFIDASFAAGQQYFQPGWNIRTGLGDFGDDLFLRAIVSRGYIGALPAEEALYPIAWTDETGESLDGQNAYVLHFEAGQLPPVSAFWSLTLYDAKDSFFVDNEIDRYAIGGFTPGLNYNADGGLDVYIQQTSPGAAKNLNWLPAPSGKFFLIMRYYEPDTTVLNGNYQTPPVRKVNKK